jgi:hypothetical protein
MVVVCVAVAACSDRAPRAAADYQWEATDAPGALSGLSDSGRLVAAGSTESGAPALWESSDASTWRLVYADPQHRGWIASVAFGKSDAVAIGPVLGGAADSTGFWYAASDSKWEYVRQFNDVYFHSLVRMRESYFAVGIGKPGTLTTVRSDDGREWVPLPMTFDTQPVVLRQVVTHHGILYAVGESQAQPGLVASIWRSKDGLSWSLDYADNAPSSANVLLSGDRVHVGGTKQQPTVWTKTDDGWQSTAVPVAGSVASIAEMRDGLAALTVPSNSNPSAFSHDSHVSIARDGKAWTSTRVVDITDTADRLPGRLFRWRDRLLLSANATQGSEIWSTKW